MQFLRSEIFNSILRLLGRASGQRAAKIRVFLTVGTLLAGSTAWAQPESIKTSASLPDGFGLSREFPGDVGIIKHDRVLFAENFENGTLEDLSKEWESVSNKDGAVLAWSTRHPAVSSGRRSLQFTADTDQNTGGHLYRRLPKEVDEVYARFYVLFDEENHFTHHFVTLGGYKPSTGWPQGGAGERPKGNDRFTIGIEPSGENGRFDPPGVWFFYTYWPEMKVSAGGRYWGNGLRPATPQVVPKNRWQCVEYRVRLNSTPEKSDGELTLWLDGRLVAHFAPGVRRSNWTGMGFALTEDPDADTFEGFRWRTDPDLRINFFWLLHFVTEAANRQHQVENPRTINRVWFDDIVVAESYIGPIYPR